ncbi:filamentous hemagglutinin family protein [Dechloromonas agitata]|uniref:filamentous haemagglutinin family protein n=1 Tax=Dechloromonas agitata TaxID=73030 RepID=UPI00237E5D96|nr:filamentous haemagglutinin family protein [Dechloromonas agitata]MDE1546606.1 filamentous hemagglutinin family protein [Dechloromonas agitata]
MNRDIYRVVFNAERNAWMAVAEIARGHGKSSSRRRRLARTLALASMAAAIGPALAAPPIPPSLSALPVPSSGARNFVFHGAVTGGAPTTAVINGINTMRVPTASQTVGLNWDSFNVGAQAAVEYTGTAMRILNRIWSNDPSQIMGRLSAPGKELYFINQNGILFGNGAQVNVGGLVASSLNMTEAMAGKLLNNGLPVSRGDSLEFAWDGNAAGFEAGFVTVDAGARITTPSGGKVVLIAPKTVQNLGLIEGGGGGEAILAAGGKVILTAPEDPNLRGLLVETRSFNGQDALGNAVALDGTVTNRSDGTADNGRIAMGQNGVVSLAALAVNQQGVVNATKAVNLNGTTMLVDGSIDADRITINQRGDKAEIDWVSGFNIGAGKTVEFVQPTTGAVAYNFVHVNDSGRASSNSNAGRSQIDGNLLANGQLFLINQLGIDVGSGASLFANNLVLSALNVHTDVLTGGLLMQGDPAKRSFYLRKAQWSADVASFEATKANALAEFSRATVNIAGGAKIRTADNGYAILAGGKVNNAGTISTPKGQTILAAGADVFLKPPFAQALRGFSAEVNPLYIVRSDDANKTWEAISRGVNANAVTNTGRVEAALGNITLVGHEITQAGVLTSSTSATANGSIRLLARDQVATAGVPLTAGAEPPASSAERKVDVASGEVVPFETADPEKLDKQTFVVGQVGGKLTLAEGSTTAVAIDGSSGKTISPDQSFLASSVEGVGAKIVVDGDILAPGGKIQFQARELFDAATAAFAGDPVRPDKTATAPANVGIFVGDNAHIDVAGMVASKSVADLFIEVELRGDEFASNPVQRNSVLRGEKAWVDIRDSVAIADLSGWTGKVGQAVEEKAASGGTVSLRSGGSVIVKSGAEIDVSGGRVDYAAAKVQESRAITRAGKVYRLNDAPTDAQYAALATVTRQEAAYSEGKSAGTVEVIGHSVALDGQLKASTTPGARQRKIGNPASDRYALPLGGRLIVQDAGQHFVVSDRWTASEAEKQAAYTQAQMVFVRGAASAAVGLDADDSAGPRLELSDSLVGAGFTRFDLQSDGRIEVPGNIALDLGPGGSFKASGRQVVVGGDITAAGGKIELVTRDMSAVAGDFPTTDDASYSTLLIENGALLSTVGTWVNDYLDGRLSSRAKSTNGGIITLDSAYDLDLRAGSVLDVSGGGLVGTDGKLSGGNAGSVVLKTGRYGDAGSASRQTSSLFADGELRAFALGKGGTLDITSPLIRVGNDYLAASRDQSAGSRLAAGNHGATLRNDWFGRGGFSQFNLNALGNLMVAENTTIQPSPLSWWLASPLAFRYVASGTALASFAPLKSLHAEVRNAPSGLSFTAGNDLSIGNGTYLGVDPGGTIKLAVERGQLTVLGTLDAPGGTISLARTVRGVDYDLGLQSKSIYLGPQAQLLARGVTRLDSATRLALEGGATPAQLLALGRYTGSVSDGGRVEIDAGLGYLITRAGSLIDVSGINDTLSQPVAGGPLAALPRLLGSAGGRVRLGAREGMFLDGDYAARGGNGALGGTFSLRLADDGSGTGWDLGQPAALTADRQLALYDGGDTHGAKWTLDGTATDAYLDGTQTLAPVTYNGKAELDTAQLARAGFGSWYLGSEGEIHFAGTQTVSVDNQLRLDAKAFSAVPGATITLKAAAAEIGNFALDAGTPAAASGGTATATVEAADIALVGSFAWSGFATSTFDSTGDIHLAGVQNSVTLPGSTRKYNGRMNAYGALVLKAARVSPTAYSDFRIDLLGDPAGSIKINRPAGAVAGDTLSVGGRLEFAAKTIDHYGTVAAPLGEIVFSAPASGGKVTLHDGSETSVAATRTSLLGETSQSGRYWNFKTSTWDNGGLTNTLNEIAAAPEKRIRVDAGESKVADGAVLNLSGGGEAVAWEFSPGPTGKNDPLLNAADKNPTLFAILPDWVGRFSGLDAAALGEYGVSQASSSGSLDFVPTLKAGDQISIAGNGSGLAAGTYTLLPARYALLPGAYLVSVKPTSNAVAAKSLQQADGSWLANATRLAASAANGSTAYSQAPLTVEVANPNVVAKRGRFTLTGATDFFFDSAGARLPGDAGQLSIVGREKLFFDPSVIASRAALLGAADGRERAGNGLELDLAAPKLWISDGTASAADTTWSTIDQDKLVALGASSVLLGGTRSNTAGTTTIETIASKVSVANAGNTGGTRNLERALSAAEMMLTAQDAITVTAGSRVESAGSAVDRSLALSGDGAFLRVAEGSQAAPVRSGASRTTGTLMVAADAAVAGRSVVLDATKETTVDGALEVGTLSNGIRRGGALAIGAGRINVIGNAPLPSEGFNLRPADVARLAAVDQLRLTSYSTLDFYDNATLGATTLKELIVSAGGIAGYGAAGDKASISAQQVRFENGNSVAAGFVAGGEGKLQVNAGQILFAGNVADQATRDAGSTGFALRGFDAVDLVASSDLRFAGRGVTSIDNTGTGGTGHEAQLTVDAGRVTTVGTADHLLTASGKTLVRGGNTAAGEDTGLGGALELRGKSVEVAALKDNAGNVLKTAGRIEAAAGRITLAATGSGAGDDVSIGEGARIAAEGRKVAFADTAAYASGGTITLSAAKGSVAVGDGATVSVSAAAGGGDAGTLNLIVTEGAVTATAGTLRGKGGTGGAGGKLRADAKTLQLDNLADAVVETLTGGGTQTHFTGQWDLRRREGNLVLNETAGATKTIRASEVNIAADNGGINIKADGTIDASGSKGGSIALQASNGDVELGGSLIARGEEVVANANNAGTRGQGGDVLLASNGGKVKTLADSVVDISAASGSAAQGGRVTFRADKSTSIANAGDLNIQLAGAVSGARDVSAEIVSRYNGNYTALNAGNTSGTTLGLTTIKNNLSTLYSTANIDTLRGHLGFGTNPLFHVRPGVEIVGASSGDFTIAADLDFSTLRFAGEAGVLTLRAQNNLKINNSISDGFLQAKSSPASYSATGRDAKIGTSEANWSYRLVAGADTNAAGVTAVKASAGSGNLDVSAGKLVRTGTGDIALAAQGNITLGDKAVVYTAGRDGTTTPANFTSSPGPNDASDQGQRNHYTKSGGDIRVSAGGNISQSATGAISDWLVTYSKGYDSTQWWSRIASFQQGFAAFGGGDISLAAGGTMNKVTAVIPTNGRVPGIDGEARADLAVIQGGGDLKVVAKNISSGLFYAETGRLAVETQQNISAKPTIALGNTTAKIVAGGSASVGNVVNPMSTSRNANLLRNSSGGALTGVMASGAEYRMRIGTYGPDSSLAITALSGDLAIEGDGIAANGVAPDRVFAAALNGSIKAKLLQMPGNDGQLDLLAARNVVIEGVTQYDTPASYLPGIENPVASGSLTDPLPNPVAGGVPASLGHSSTPWHADDQEASRIVALNGDISGPGNKTNATLWLNEAAKILAAGDVRDLSIVTQHAHSSDVTRIEAGGKLELPTGTGAYELQTQIKVGGSGQVEVLAKEGVSLGSSAGISSRGNLENPYLSEGGADITVIAGTTQPDYAGFLAWLQGKGLAVSDTSEAGLRTRFFEVLRDAGKAAQGGSGEAGYAEGRAAIAALFPGATLTPANIDLFYSAVKTEQGGNIALLAPAGGVTVGLATPDKETIKLKKPSEQGLFTFRGGSIQTLVQDSFLVNQSRVFTLDGGDILVWADQGSIDAGSGAKTVSATPPPVLVIRNGQIVLDASNSVAGSGIGALASRDDTPASDVYLFAPQGAIDAGDAGLRSTGNVTLGAQQVLNASNIQAAGTVSGAPAATATAPVASVTTPKNDLDKVVDEAAPAAGKRGEGALGILTVEVLGGEECEGKDKNCNPG